MTKSPDTDIVARPPEQIYIYVAKPLDCNEAAKYCDKSPEQIYVARPPDCSEAARMLPPSI